ncbi:MAG: mandelate racemase [Actinomycetota bacterium]|nr:mandelate racemase [Actinomycetota bacterium]
MSAIDEVGVAAYTVPAEKREADGTLEWSSTSVVVVEASAGGVRGLGHTYAPRAAAALIHDQLAEVVTGNDPLDVPGAWEAMVRSVRNIGRPGLASRAIAAVDVALWDLKGKLLGTSVARLLGAVRTEVPVYASGGFISYGDDELAERLAGWVREWRIPRVKMKVGTGGGTDPGADLRRVALAREAIGPRAELYVDANGAYSVKQAVSMARRMAELGVTWFEEPVSSDDLDGLRRVAELIDLEVAAGEYATTLFQFLALLRAGAVDILQADLARCAGITEWLRAAALAASFNRDISGHVAQSLHVHPACAVPNLRHIEYFEDHHRVERLLFDGVLDPVDGRLRPDLDRPGLGLELRRADAARFATSAGSTGAAAARTRPE